MRRSSSPASLAWPFVAARTQGIKKAALPFEGKMPSVKNFILRHSPPVQPVWRRRSMNCRTWGSSGLSVRSLSAHCSASARSPPWA